MRRAFRKDSTERAIRTRAEALGFLWLESTANTKGRPDACLLRSGETYWCEVKSKGEPFTAAQLDEFPRLIAVGVPVYVLEDVEDVHALLNGTLRAWSPADVGSIHSRGRGSRAKRPRVHKPGVSKARTLGEMCIGYGCTRSKADRSRFCLAHIPNDATPANPARQSNRRKTS